ncbi:MAG: 6-pyruvoyl-tetrahydropterin synthase-related protein [Candidatus Parcubacteria bacterium]|nr:6-pyruvoyl-tetrahydropterin synthase-related protein [Candidatus Parcubacteria bacterium]
MIIKCRKYTFFIVLILVSFIPLFDLFKPGLPLTHDGQDHVARIANFYQNLSEGNIIPRWAGNLNWGYGHPILEFLYPLPSYFASLFHFLGFSLVDATKLVFGVSFVLSALAMYVFVRELLKDEKAALLAGLLYVIAPYRFVDLYVRGAIGEHVAFIFPPLIFYFLTKLSKNYSYRYVLGGSFSLAGLILSHNAIALMFFPLIALYIFYLFFQCFNKKYFISNILCLIFFGFGLSAFFWIPAFMEGKYTLRNIVTSGGEYLISFVAWKDFFFGLWSYGGTLVLSKQIGIIHWVGVIGSVIATYHLYKKQNKLWLMCLGSFIILGITLFLMTSSSNPVWQVITILQKFQFPWRFLSVAVFLSALMGGILLFVIPNKYKNMSLLILVACLLFVNKDSWHAQSFLQKEEDFYSGIYNGTTDTGESAPIWSIRFMEKRPKSKTEIIDGRGKVTEIKRKIISREYNVTSLNGVRILENTLYFPGWTVLVDRKPVNIEFQDQNHRGLMTFNVNRGEHLVNIIFKETKIRLFSDIASTLSAIIIGGFIVFRLIRKKMYNKK